MNLPRHRRIHWPIWRRNNRRALALFAVAIIAAMLVYAGLAYALKHVEVSDYRLRLVQLQHDVMSVRTFGQLTATDFEERTTELTTRRIK